MEMAIGVMFLMIAFTIMLLSTAGLQNRPRNEDYKKFNQMIEVNYIGEHVLQNIDDYLSISTSIIKIDDLDEITEKYYVQCSTSETNKIQCEIFRGEVESGELVLTIIIDTKGTDDQTDDTITSWK